MIYHKALEIFSFIAIGVIGALMFERFGLMPGVCVLDAGAYEYLLGQEPIPKK